MCIRFSFLLALWLINSLPDSLLFPLVCILLVPFLKYCGRYIPLLSASIDVYVGAIEFPETCVRFALVPFAKRVVQNFFFVGSLLSVAVEVLDVRSTCSDSKSWWF